MKEEEMGQQEEVEVLRSACQAALDYFYRSGLGHLFVAEVHRDAIRGPIPKPKDRQK